MVFPRPNRARVRVLFAFTLLCYLPRAFLRSLIVHETPAVISTVYARLLAMRGWLTGFVRYSAASTLVSVSYALAAVDPGGSGGDPLIAASPRGRGGVTGAAVAAADRGTAGVDVDAAVEAAAAVSDPNAPPDCCCCCWSRDGGGSPVSTSTAHTDTRLAAHEAARSW